MGGDRTLNLFNIPTHAKSPRIVNAVIEIEKGSSVKYEYDENLCAFRYDRSLDSAMVYPANYGSIPGTLCDDGDPLDILVITQRPIDKGTVVESKVLGVLDMDDDGEKDYKVLAVPISTIRRFRNLNDVEHVSSAIPFGPGFGHLTLGYFDAPRTVGIDMHYKF